MTPDEYLALCADCQTVQQQTLMEIVESNRNCAFGKNHNFDKIKSIEDFTKEVPLTEWSDIKEMAYAMRDGAADLLFEGQPELFILTSGTSGKEKLLPETKRGIQIKSQINSLRISFCAKHFPDIQSGKLLPMANKAVEGLTPAGIPYGSASGVTLMTTSDTLRNMVSYPLEITRIDDPEALDYAIMRCSITQDVRLVIGNNAGRFEQLTDIVEQNTEAILHDIEYGGLNADLKIAPELRAELEAFLPPNPAAAARLREAAADRLTPDIYWKNLRLISCWLGGSVGAYAEKLRPKLPGIGFMEFGYGASEGKFNIATIPETPAGPLAIFGVFFEFRTTDGSDEILPAHAVEDGKTYDLIVTTHSGLYRYPMHDLVRVEGFTGNTPNIVFVSKSSEIANLCGEKTPPNTLANVIKDVSSKTFEIANWCLVVDKQNFRYNFCIEPVDETAATGFDTEKLAQIFEDSLTENAARLYRIFRQQKLIEPATVTLMQPGWHDAWRESRKREGDSGNQIKLPLICDSIPLPEKSGCPE
jgi:hypothetical protein